jgi:hypothetical protein
MLNLDQLDAQTALPENTALSSVDLAAKLSAPILTPKKTVVTSTSLGAIWGVTAAATLKATLRGMIADGGSNGDLADYVLGVLEGAGFDPSNAVAVATAQQFVVAKIITQDQLNAAFYDTSYLCGDVCTAADVDASRARLVRRAAIAAIQQRTGTVIGNWLNEKMNPAAEDASQPVPTWNDFLAIVDAG